MKKIFIAFILAIALSAIPVHAVGAKLTWEPPLTKVNGNPLDDLQGFYVYQGDAPDNYTSKINIPDPLAITYEATGLDFGTTYFKISAYNQYGEGGTSPPVSKTVSSADCGVNDPTCAGEVPHGMTVITVEIFPEPGDTEKIIVKTTIIGVP